MPLSKKLVRRSNELLESIHSWAKKRVETVQVLRGLADELMGHNKNVHVAKVSGSSFSFAGFVLMATGFGLTPVTLGTSAILSAVGGAIALRVEQLLLVQASSEVKFSKQSLPRYRKLLKPIAKHRSLWKSF